MEHDTPLVGRVLVAKEKRAKGGVRIYLRWRYRKDGKVRWATEPTGLGYPKYARRRERHDALSRAERRAVNKAERLRDPDAPLRPDTMPARAKMVKLSVSVTRYLASVEDRLAPTTLEDRAKLLAEWLVWVEENTLRLSWYWRERQVEPWPAKRPSQIARNGATLAEWAAHRAKRITARGRPPSPGTLIIEYTHLEGWLRWCWEQGYTRQLLSLQPHIDEQKRLLQRGSADHPRRERHSLEDENLRAILAGIRYDRTRIGLRLLAVTGMRRSELVGALAERWDAAAATLTIVGAKVYKERTIPLGRRTNTALADYRADLHDEPKLIPGLGPTTPNTWLKRRPITPHDLRRWFSTTLLRLDCPRHIQRILMGHAIPRTDEAYMLAQAYRVSDGRPWVQAVEDRLDDITPP